MTEDKHFLDLVARANKSTKVANDALDDALRYVAERSGEAPGFGYLDRASALEMQRDNLSIQMARMTEQIAAIEASPNSDPAELSELIGARSQLALQRRDCT